MGWAGPPGPAGGRANSARTCGSNFCEAAPRAAGTRPEPSPSSPAWPSASWSPRGRQEAPREAGEGWEVGAVESADAAWRGGGRAAPGSPGAKDGGGGKGAGPGLVRRRLCGYRRSARILWPIRGGEGVSGDAGPPDQEIQVSPSPPPPAPGSPPSTATHCLVTICLSLTTARRGFGFVTFMDQAGVDKVLAQSRHELDSKTVSGPRG